MSRDQEPVIPTRRSLLTRLKNWDDQEGWRQFFDTYWKLIYGVALRAGLTEQEAQDVVQETVLSVAKTMPRFKYEPAKCSFKTWLQHLTRKRIVDQYRKRDPAHARGGGASDDTTGTARTATVEAVPDPASLQLEAMWDDEWQRNLLDAAIERVKARADPKQYQIFHLYVIKQMPVPTVVRSLRVSAARVYLAKHRISALIKKEVKRLETRMT